MLVSEAQETHFTDNLFWKGCTAVITPGLSWPCVQFNGHWRLPTAGHGITGLSRPHWPQSGTSWTPGSHLASWITFAFYRTLVNLDNSSCLCWYSKLIRKEKIIITRKKWQQTKTYALIQISQFLVFCFCSWGKSTRPAAALVCGCWCVVAMKFTDVRSELRGWLRPSGGSRGCNEAAMSSETGLGLVTASEATHGQAPASPASLAHLTRHNKQSLTSDTRHRYRSIFFHLSVFCFSFYNYYLTFLTYIWIFRDSSSQRKNVLPESTIWFMHTYYIIHTYVYGLFNWKFIFCDSVTIQSQDTDPPKCSWQSRPLVLKTCRRGLLLWS